MSTVTQYRAFVVGILSGDSLICKFLPECPIGLQVVSLKYLVAPKYGLPDGKVKDEPHGFNSWDYLRRLCIGQKITISARAKPIERSRTHPAFGKMPVTYSRVTLITNNEEIDVGRAAVTAGMVRMRPRQGDSNFDQPYLKSLQDAEKKAQEAGIGIWAPDGFVRELPVGFNDNEILDTREFDAIVDSVINGTTLSLFLLPKHFLVHVHLAGVRAVIPKKKDDERVNPLGIEAKEMILRGLLHKKVRIRICLKKKEMFIGCLLCSADGGMIALLKDGLAEFVQSTAEFAPNADLYIAAEVSARIKGLNKWKDVVYEPKAIKNFEGICRSVRGSNALVLTNGQEKRTFYLSCLKVPHFGTIIDVDRWGFEARQYLRKNYVGKKLTAKMTGGYGNRDYAAIYCDTVCVNERLLRNGFAELCEPFVGERLERWEQMQALNAEARNAKIGIWSDVKGGRVVVTDLTPFKERQDTQKHLESISHKKLNGVIERTTSGSKFIVFVPERGLLIRVNVNKVCPYSVDDKNGTITKEFANTNFLQCDTEVVIVDMDLSGSFRADMTVTLHDGRKVDIAEYMIENGMAELLPRLRFGVDASTNLIEAQKRARQSSVGIWEDKTRHFHDIVFGRVETVKVVAVWDPVTLGIQFMGEAMDKVNAVLADGESLRLLDHPPHKNECVIISNTIDQMRRFIRARVDDMVNGREKWHVKAIDFSAEAFEMSLNELYECPEELLSIEPQARSVKLACCEQTETPDLAIDSIWEVCTNARLFLHLLYEEDRPAVLLTDQEEITSGSLNVYLVGKKLVKYAPHELAPQFAEIQRGFEQTSQKLEVKQE